MGGWVQRNPFASGFQNAGGVGVVSGHDSVILTGGDTAGIHKSGNKGTLFVNRDGSLVNVDTHIACIEPHPTQASRWFALTGNGTAGSVFESTDEGETWTDVSSGTAAIFGDGALAGNSGANSLLGSNHGEHPRSVGRLIAIDSANGYIYVGTFKNGIYRGTLGASSGVTAWTRIGLAPGTGTVGFYIRGVTYDATNDVVYASTFSDPGSNFSTQGGHVYRITSPHGGSPTVTAMTGSPFCASAMLLIGDRLYTVAHPITANLTDAGLWYIDTAHSIGAATAWTKVSQLPTNTGARWMSIDGYKVGAVTTIWCGSAGDGVHSLYKLVFNGTTWAATLYPTSQGTVHDDMGGPHTPTHPWWLYTFRSGMMLGHATFVASTIRINKFNTNEIYVFGRSGAWRTLDGGATWYPIVEGIGATVALSVIADPVTLGRVYVGLGDWSLLASANGLDTVTNPAPPYGSFNYAMCVDESRTPVEVIEAASVRQDVTPLNSKIWRNPDVIGSGTWIDTGLNVAGAIIVGICVCYSGASRVYIAGDGSGGLHRKVGDGGAWAIVPNANMSPAGGINFAGTDTHPFARKLGRSEIYLYDRSTGVWRSTDAGLHWVRIWNHPSGGSDLSGWIAVHPTDPTVLYVSDQTSVYKITNANTCAQDAATTVTIGAALGARGPMAVDPINMKIGVCDVTSTPKFWESPLGAISWVDKSDALYHNAVAAPQWLTYDRSGQPIIALSGNGVIGLASGNSAPAFTAPPILSGSAVEGGSIHTSDGTASGTPPPTITRKYQFSSTADGSSGWSDIPALTALDVNIPGGGTYIGKYISVLETASNGVSPDDTSRSNIIGPVTATSSAPLFTTPNTVSAGPYVEGGLITWTAGTTVGTPAPTKTWSIEQSGSGAPGSWAAIGGATGSGVTATYTPPPGSAGAYYRPHYVADNGVAPAADQWGPKIGPVVAAVGVNDGPPIVSIISPVGVVGSASQTMQIAVSSPDGITSVEGEVASGGFSAATLNPTTGFYEMPVTLVPGDNLLSARATDAFPGSPATSAPVSITINYKLPDPPPPPPPPPPSVATTDLASFASYIYDEIAPLDFT